MKSKGVNLSFFTKCGLVEVGVFLPYCTDRGLTFPGDTNLVLVQLWHL